MSGLAVCTVTRRVSHNPALGGSAMRPCEWDPELVLNAILLCHAQGSYYVRQGVRDYNETWGLLTDDWAAVRSASLVSELRALQTKTLGHWDLWPDPLTPHEGRGT